MDRITEKDLKKKVDHFNDRLEGCDIKIALNHRYDYIGIDIMRGFAQEDTIKTGLTKKAAWDYLEVLEKGMDLAKRCNK